MNTEFENHSRVTTKILEEFVWNQSIITKWIARIFIIGYFITLIITAFLVIRDKTIYPLNAWLVFLGTCILGYLWYGPHSTAKRMLRSVEDACAGEIPDTVLTFDEEITSESALGLATYDYDQILKIYSLKHSYILLMDNKKGLPVSRSGFVKGTFPEFKEFLREKRPDLTIPE